MFLLPLWTRWAPWSSRSTWTRSKQTGKIFKIEVHFLLSFRDLLAMLVHTGALALQETWARLGPTVTMERLDRKVIVVKMEVKVAKGTLVLKDLMAHLVQQDPKVDQDHLVNQANQALLEPLAQLDRPVNLVGKDFQV